jgi:SAM-dependent methyltransferase
MTWDKDAPYRPEVQKCRPRLLRFCEGQGLDVGCGPEKVTPAAIGVDRKSDVSIDISAGLDLFTNEQFDFIFSSHCLEDMRNPAAILRDWWSKIKVGGHLILYLPHKDFYPNMGEEGANPAHKNDFVPEDIIGFMDGFASYELVHNEVHSEDDEYSFELVFKKAGSLGLPAGKAITKSQANQKKVLVIRYGAFGDLVIATPLFKRLKEDGYHVTLNCTHRADPVVKNNPNVDEIWYQPEGVTPIRELDYHWDRMSRGFDKVINLSETCETKFLFASTQKEYKYPVQKRRKLSGAGNYYEYALKVGGYTDVERPIPELYPTAMEQSMAAMFRSNHRDEFLLMWALNGSSLHKVYGYSAMVANTLIKNYRDIRVVTVGDYACKLMEADFAPGTIKRSDEWDIRTSMLMTQWVDCVVSPETGVLNAAGCFDTPKIGMLTHSNKRNLTHHFKNDYSVQASCSCSPCHRLLFIPDCERDCPKFSLGFEESVGREMEVPICTVSFDPHEIYALIEKIYFKWHEKRGTKPRPKSTLIEAPKLYGPDGAVLREVA